MRSNCRSFFKSFFLTLTLVTSGFAFSMPAFADNKGPADGGAPDADDAKCPPDRGGPGGMRGRHFHGLGEGFGRMPLDFSMVNLSEEQKNKISTIRNRNMARGKELRQQLMSKKGEMRDLMFSADATNEQILAKRNELKGLFDEAETLRMTDFLAMRSVLTPEQRKKWAESKPAERPGFERGGRPGRGPEPEGDRPDKGDKPPAKAK